MLCPMQRLVLRVAALVGLMVLAGGMRALAAGDGGGAGVRITYLANEGFLLEAGETRVLVDALFGDGLSGYPVVPAAVRADLEGARGRFAGVDLVLASHFHGDHFDAAAVVRHLKANPKAVFLSTRQAVAELRRELGPAAEGLELVAALPEEGETTRLELPGVAVEVLNLHHGRDRRPPVENLGLVLRLGGLTLLHVGDTEASEADLRPYRESLAGVEVWMLPSWLLGEPAWRAARDWSAKDGWQIAMHLPAASAPRSWFGAAGDLDAYLASLREALPDAWVPVEPLASRQYPTPAP